MNVTQYQPRRVSRSDFLSLRGHRYHVLQWGQPSQASPERPPLVLMHGWMDVAASFQFVVDALDQNRYVIAADWRGFGLSDSSPSDSYWFPDYLGDLDALLDALAPNQPVDLLGHSMGGNVVMLYAGIRPKRIRRLVNLEGFGMPVSDPDAAPARYAQWLDELKTPSTLRGYPSQEAVAQRLQKTNPLLRTDRALWLAAHWSRPDAQGVWQILGDPAHKRSNPIQYQRDEALACWRRIEAPVLWVEGDLTDTDKWWAGRYSKREFHERLKVVPHAETCVLSPAGHMLHHDQPEALAARLERFLNAPAPAA